MRGDFTLRKLIKRFAEYISDKNNYNSEEREQVEYAVRVVTFETLKVIGSMIIFSLIGYPIQAIVVIITMFSTKPFIGGYHEDTQIKCFTASLILTGSIILLGINININFISLIILDGISFYTIWHQAPIINPKMQLNRQDLILRNRKTGILMVLFFIILTIVFYNNSIIKNTICWTLVFQAMFMFNKRS